MFYTFTQNNSGGHMVRDEWLSDYVIIEAENHADACNRAEGIGIYFDGVEKGWDCACCGSRWSNYFDEPDEVPSIYGEPLETYRNANVMREAVVIHYIDGRVEKVAL